MHVKLIEGKKLPRHMCLLLNGALVPFIPKEIYRALQAGKSVDIKDDGAEKLIADGFCIEVEAIKKKGAVKDGTESTD